MPRNPLTEAIMCFLIIPIIAAFVMLWIVKVVYEFAAQCISSALPRVDQLVVIHRRPQMMMKGNQ